MIIAWACSVIVINMNLKVITALALFGYVKLSIKRFQIFLV